MQAQIGKAAIIDWKDCCFNSGNTYTEDELREFKIATLHTIVWIIEKVDAWIVYDEFNSGEKTYRHIIDIPKSGIIKITYLEEVKDKRKGEETG